MSIHRARPHPRRATRRSADGLDLYDLELNGGVLRVVVDRRDAGGVGMDAITQVTRPVSRALDEHDPIDGRFTLEVSSPGLERTLRTPEHFRGAVGTVVAVKTPRAPPGRPALAGHARIGRRRGGRGDPRRRLPTSAAGSATTRSSGPARCSSGVRPPSPAVRKRNDPLPRAQPEAPPSPGKKVIAS